MTEDLLRLAKTPTLGEIAGRNTDPRFFAAISILPNPDPILRKAGKSEDVFDAIQSDAHVIGELRSIKADLQRYAHVLTPGGERRVDRRAFELCQTFLDRQPAPYTRWPDVVWNIAQSTFRGLSVQEIVWEKQGDLFMPRQILDRPKRRFIFNGEGALRVVTREQPLFGIAAERLYFLVDRHMASYDQPYGIALFSSCFWPYVFKHAGYKWVVKFCERFGVPFPKGTYPVGASKETVDALEAALENMIDAGYAVLEEGSQVDVLDVKVGTGAAKLPQQNLIDTCNAEMSKALTSQTLATEQTGRGGGSHAASQTHSDRAAGVNEGDRERIAKTLNELWSLITEINIGKDARPPTSDFLGDSEATLERANVYKVFIDAGGSPSRKAMAEDLGIELQDPTDPNDALHAPTQPTPAVQPAAGAAAQFSRFSRPDGLTPLQQLVSNIENRSESALKPVFDPIFSLVEHAQSLEEIRDGLLTLYPDLDTTRLAELMRDGMATAYLAGRFEVDQGR